MKRKIKKDSIVALPAGFAGFVCANGRKVAIRIDMVSCIGEREDGVCELWMKDAPEDPFKLKETYEENTAKLTEARQAPSASPEDGKPADAPQEAHGANPYMDLFVGCPYLIKTKGCDMIRVLWLKGAELKFAGAKGSECASENGPSQTVLGFSAKPDAPSSIQIPADEITYIAIAKFAPNAPGWAGSGK